MGNSEDQQPGEESQEDEPLFDLPVLSPVPSVCPGQAIHKVVVRGENAHVCSYNLTVLALHVIRDKSILTLPTEIMMEFWRLVGGEIGAIAYNAYRREGNSYIVEMRPSKGSEHYRHATHRHSIFTERGAKNYDNRNQIAPDKGVWKFDLPKPQALGPRNWYGAVFVWLSHHPDIKPDIPLCDSLADKAKTELLKLAGQNMKAPPERRRSNAQEEQKDIDKPT